MVDHITKELEYYSRILESHFHDMMDIEFTVENNKLYILSSRVGKRSDFANLIIVMNLFCECKISVHDVFRKLSYQQIVTFLDTEYLINAHELKFLMQGSVANSGVASATICYSVSEAKNFLKRQEEFILCQEEIFSDVTEIVSSKYCKGVITARGGMTSHAAVLCRRIHKPCVCGVGDFRQVKNIVEHCDSSITLDGNNGKVFAGIGKIRKSNKSILEIKMLYELLFLVIKYNIITSETSPLIWRLWDVIVLNKRYGKNNARRLLLNKAAEYKSFNQPEKSKINDIYSTLKSAGNINLLVEDFIGFLFDELSAQVPLGNHFLYMRPTLNPMDTIRYRKGTINNKCIGEQLIGVEFFHINKFIDFLIDIYSIKIYFNTEFYKNSSEDEKDTLYLSLNYLDYVNPYGESLIINNYNAKKIAIYINDVLVPVDEIAKIYHLIRRRKYYWTWYQDNVTSKKEIIDYLRTKNFQNNYNSRLYLLCNEMQLIHNNRLTLAGESLIGENIMKKNRNVDYILEQVLQRGYNDKSNEFDDFSKLIQKKDFKDLIALELYEYYFFYERHEFDLQLVKEIVDNVADYFSNPEVIRQLETGLIQTIPSTIIITLVNLIWSKLKLVAKNNGEIKERDSSWNRIKNNINKIDKEFLNHDYILAEEIEQIFGASREEIQPLLKLCGCKCYLHKNRSIWIRPGTEEERIKEILKLHNFKVKH